MGAVVLSPEREREIGGRRRAGAGRRAGAVSIQTNMSHERKHGEEHGHGQVALPFPPRLKSVGRLSVKAVRSSPSCMCDYIYVYMERHKSLCMIMSRIISLSIYLVGNRDRVFSSAKLNRFQSRGN